MKTRLIFSMLIVLVFNTSCEKEDNGNDNNDAIIDAGGNVYTSVTIGNQTWLVENLKTTHFNNGDPIENFTEGDQWNILADSPGYAAYENNSANIEAYGLLYNWYAVNDDRGIAPEGYHVATNDEWNALLEAIGDDQPGNKMREVDPNLWLESPVTGANESGFSAVPAGHRWGGGFEELGRSTRWWTATSLHATHSYIRGLTYFGGEVTEFTGNISLGNSVRCVKD